MSQLPEWATAHGGALTVATIRSQASDFQVTEICTIDFTGEGEHDFLWIEKSATNTHWVAERLASFASVPVRDVGYAGMKDRHAVTRQWFSVRRTGDVEWSRFAADGVVVLEQQQHRRKLRRGAHSGNSFKIALRSAAIAQHADVFEQRLQLIAEQGVPNYFGAQRFGRGGGNISLCKSLFAGRKMSRAKRSIALSTARSLIFNDFLNRRVCDQTWNKILPGELANLNGSGSVFPVDELSEELAARCEAQDIHPSGPLWGDGSPRSTGIVARLESATAEDHRDLAQGLVAARMEPASRALRLLVSDLRHHFDDGVLWLEFNLTKGGYATSVLRELVTVTGS
ncbi:MAG: tRNA pseudouridine(13) synthase TruD [Woeseiaceae bacterium]